MGGHSFEMDSITHAALVELFDGLDSEHKGIVSRSEILEWVRLQHTQLCASRSARASAISSNFEQHFSKMSLLTRSEVISRHEWLGLFDSPRDMQGKYEGIQVSDKTKG